MPVPPKPKPEASTTTLAELELLLLRLCVLCVCVCVSVCVSICVLAGGDALEPEAPAAAAIWSAAPIAAKRAEDEDTGATGRDQRAPPAAECSLA